MADKKYVILEGRSCLSVAGEDARSFLQGLISNDVEKVAPGSAIHAAFLTPQGKYLHDFFVVQVGDVLYLDGEKDRIADLFKRMRMYKLRSKVDLVQCGDDVAVAALIGGGEEEAEGIVPDPRLAALGGRAVLPAGEIRATLEGLGYTEAPFEVWDRLRLSLGVPDGSRDMTVERSILLEFGFDELKGVDFDKGCYMGQELTARTKHRALIKKRLVPVTLDGAAPEPGTPVVSGGKEVGEMRSSSGDLGVAMMRLEALEDADAEFEADGTGLGIVKPDWAEF